MVLRYLLWQSKGLSPEIPIVVLVCFYAKWANFGFFVTQNTLFVNVLM